MTELAWETVATFLHREPAGIVWSVLDGHGIPARVRGEDVGGYAGVALGNVWVEVPTDQAEAARALLDSSPRHPMERDPSVDVTASPRATAAAGPRHTTCTGSM